MNYKDCNHDWSMWETLYYEEFHVAYGSIRTCKICKAREFNDWCSTRTGSEFKLLPPENQTTN